MSTELPSNFTARNSKLNFYETMAHWSQQHHTFKEAKFLFRGEKSEARVRGAIKIFQEEL